MKQQRLHFLDVSQTKFIGQKSFSFFFLVFIVPHHFFGVKCVRY